MKLINHRAQTARLIVLAQGIVPATLMVLMSVGCTNTVTGMGKDIQKMGQSMNSQSSTSGTAAKANPSDSLSQGKDVVVTPVVVTPTK
ncbi:hypothetical protein LZG75_07310 [Polynucleobacter sp. IMCC30063]|uniref:hypothetical protein n=1 Tax=unclassified Polynucleobacter TaxID=2640945 RepID=UPI001F480258|nr:MULTISPECIES: hypothetical protein [unclassified Polynucleobacter]MCE7506047.1 hypothetical protein [Polynucleobacter sp. IMCC30063]MCE7527211.1 hypothetical protein [Polynucleobacter sp. IMCC 30228]MCE7528932.1 hypothetical protein [Polynucleobacter sp. IMCC 29146]